jgi:FkbH-like protein
MRLSEALTILRREPPPNARTLDFCLACGFTPLHLATFLSAEIRTAHPRLHPEIRTGLFGDLPGNIERISQERPEAAAVVLEWPDLDPRLGIRQLGGWGPGNLGDIVATVETQADMLANVVATIGCPVAFSLPTLPLPPVSYLPRRQAGTFEADLQNSLTGLASRLARVRGLRLLNRDHLDKISSVLLRRDVKAELSTGFPFTLPHASALAELLARLLGPATPKKGLITDLDDTLWRGIVGDVGVDGISWDLGGHSQVHGLYQQFLKALDESGILIAVASKNSPELVDAVFRRQDMVLPRESVFPLEVHWSAKSESVSRILKAWNIAADSVVFVDDSPLELAEVRAQHPGLECLRFPTDNDGDVLELLGLLRDRFGKDTLTQEDALRRASLRNTAQIGPRPIGPEASNADAFLEQVGAVLTLDFTKDDTDPRALELVNKTNQFNLNGRRYTEGHWREQLGRPDSILLRVGYADKFGPLGTIAVLTGQMAGNELHLVAWVMSCRAFSRRIEYRCLEQLYEQLGVESVVFDYQPTPRNGPLTEFFKALLDTPPEPGFRLPRSRFSARSPTLLHKLKLIGLPNE